LKCDNLVFFLPKRMACFKGLTHGADTLCSACNSFNTGRMLQCFVHAVTDGVLDEMNAYEQLAIAAVPMQPTAHQLVVLQYHTPVPYTSEVVTSRRRQ
jgi:hypothetical protein